MYAFGVYDNVLTIQNSLFFAMFLKAVSLIIGHSISEYKFLKIFYCFQNGKLTYTKDGNRTC